MRLFLLMASAALTGCVAQSPAQLPPVSSTEGSTLVQRGVVTEVSASQVRGGAHSASTAARLTVRIDNGVLSLDIEDGQVFRVGDPVEIVIRNNVVTILR
jgi:hypothetical protein